MAIHRNCDGVLRRDFIQLGLRGALGLGLCDLLRLKAGATEQTAAARPGKNINCIMIWLDGGPSHFETFDPKPDAPADIRGSRKAAVPSIHGHTKWTRGPWMRLAVQIRAAIARASGI